jgi:plasmid stabilization system protein ParE
MRLRFSRRAEAALEEVADYIARDNPMRAASFVRELRKRCRRWRFPKRRSALDQSAGVKVNFEARTILIGPETKRQRPL